MEKPSIVTMITLICSAHKSKVEGLRQMGVRHLSTETHGLPRAPTLSAFLPSSCTSQGFLQETPLCRSAEETAFSSPAGPGSKADVCVGVVPLSENSALGPPAPSYGMVWPGQVHGAGP